MHELLENRIPSWVMAAPHSVSFWQGASCAVQEDLQILEIIPEGPKEYTDWHPRVQLQYDQLLPMLLLAAAQACEVHAPEQGDCVVLQ